MKLAKAYVVQWWHTLINIINVGHIGMSARQSTMERPKTTTVWLGCTCGKSFYGDRPAWLDKITAYEKEKKS